MAASRLATISAALLLTTTLASAAKLELRLQDNFGPFTPGSTVTVALWMTELDGTEAAGFQAFFEFNPESIVLVDGSYTPAPFSIILLPIDAAFVANANNTGVMDIASGIDFFGGEPATEDSQLATFVFEAQDAFCIPAVDFRDHEPPARITDSVGLPVEPLVLSAFPSPPCAADVDGDNTVAFGDLLIVLSSWGGPCPGDVDSSGTVDFGDLLFLLSNWGPCPR